MDKLEFVGHPRSGEKEDIAVLAPVARSILLRSGKKKLPKKLPSDTEDTDKDEVIIREENDVIQSRPLREL